MEIIRIPRIVQDTCWKHLMKGRSIGFVPTMGALHEGHLSLVRRAQSENDITVVSIFVNPTQFGPNEDFARYPRPLEADIAKLRDEDVSLLFLPEPAAVYPDGFRTSVTVESLSEKLCGAYRPGHFTGVATVVIKFLNIVNPTRAYFGQKDFQQTVIIKRLVKDLNLTADIIVCPTIREADGLAMSSRNAYLSPSEREAARILYQALSEAADMIKQNEQDVHAVTDRLHAALTSEQLVKSVDYAAVLDPETLEEPGVVDEEVVIAAAIRIGSTRLIDNILARPEKSG